MNRQIITIAIFLLLAVVSFSCEKKSDVRPVAVIGMDGLEWRIVREMISKGELPNLKRIIENGTVSEMETLQPTLSPAIWTTIATGVLPEEHGITWFLVKDANGQMMPVTSAQRRVNAIWNIVSEYGRKVDVLGWWATWPSETVNGRIVSDHIGYRIFDIQSDKIDTEVGNTYPEGLKDELSVKNVDPFDIPLADIKRYMKISDLEYNVSVDMKSLCLRPEYKDCLYCKGESDVPFCHFNPLHHFLRALATLETFNSISSTLINQKQPDLFMVYFEWVDVVSHQYMKFTPPHMDGILDEQYSKYNDVIRQAYIRQDEVLGEVLAALSPDTNVFVISDHGFKIGDERLSEEKVTNVAMAHIWHHEPAFLAMYGPDISKGGKQIKSHVQDITPTILALMALPVGQHMEGKVLKDAIKPSFLKKHPVVRKKYQFKGDESGQVASKDEASGSNIDPQIKEKLQALGYIGAVDNTGLEFNRVMLLVDKGRFQDAVDVLEIIMAKKPDDLRAIMMLGEVYLQTNRFKKAAQTDALIENIDLTALKPGENQVISKIKANWGIALTNMGDLEGGKEKCEQALSLQDANYIGYFCLGIIAERQQRTDQAIDLYTKAIELYPASAVLHNNLGNCYMRKEKFQKAIEHYKKAAQINPSHIECQHNAGIAYQKTGKAEEAEKKFRAALMINPNFAPSLEELGNILMKRKEFKAAAGTFEHLTNLKPLDPMPLFLAARAKIASNNTEAALEMLKKAMALNPTATKQLISTDPLFKGINPEQLK